MRGKRSLILISGLALAVSLALPAGVFAQEAAYVGNTQCKFCHNKKEEGEQWNKWKAEDHAKAFANLSSDAAKALAQKKNVAKPPAEAPECLKCHVTAFDPATGKTPDRIIKDDGVQCESCHGPSSLHLVDGKKFKSGDKSVNIAAHQPLPDQKVCLKCHNEESATWNPERYTLPDGKKAGFDFKQAWEKIAHPNPLKKKS